MDMHFSGSVSQIVSNPFVFYKLIDNQINLSLSMKKKGGFFSLFFILFFTLDFIPPDPYMNLDGSLANKI